jgi:ApbE superfamily uncharacterized protein (UPF0280 family)
MLMNIAVSNRGVPNPIRAREGAQKAVKVLKSLARFRTVITQKIGDIGSVSGFPPVVRKMVEAARYFEDPTITPLIGVAGAGADEVADFIYAKNNQVDKVIINNGGDIAIRLTNQETATIGIKSDLTKMGISHVLTVSTSCGLGGLATSGFGGRSFTRGIANAAVAFAGDAISADIAATLIGNATDVESPHIERILAKNLYPSTDIPDLLVTKRIGHLETSEIEEALESGMRKAKELQDRGLIIGAFIAVRDQYGVSDSMVTRIQPVSDLLAV